MAKVNIQALKDLIVETKEATVAAVLNSPIFKEGKTKTEALKAGLDEAKCSLQFELLEDENFDIDNIKIQGSDAIDDDLSFRGTPTKQLHVMVNWLVLLVGKIKNKVIEHNKFVKFFSRQLDEKVDLKAMEELQQKCDNLERECDEVRQRNMKGNIIISSPTLGHKQSVLISEMVNDAESHTRRREDTVEMCLRAIRLKTGVSVPVSDIMACHILPNRRGGEPSYILRFGNRRPKSAWDTLAAGMLTGKNYETNANFNKNYNLFINFQITKSRTELVNSKRLSQIFVFCPRHI